MSKPTITVLVGMIGSGKSTYCKLAAEKGYIIVNDDAIVNALHGNKYKLYEPVLKPLYKSIENHIIAVAIASQRSVVVDRGLDICVKARRRWIALANSLDVLCNSVIFPKDKVETHAYRRVVVFSLKE